MSLPAMIFAAGFGTRMRPLTETRPKPLVEVGGRALIDHAIGRLAQAGIRRAAVNLHYLGDQVRAHLAGETRMEIGFSEERPAILDTAGGLRAALPLLRAERVLTMNPDCLFFGPDPVACLSGDADAILLLVPRERAMMHKGRGDFFADPLLRRRGTAAEAPYVYTGLQAIRTSTLTGLPPGPVSLNAVWDRLMAQGRIGFAIYPGRWIDIGHPDAIAVAEAELA